jgi:transcriptional regulator with XRE-family HTH domain
MPSRERLRAFGLQQADSVSRRLGREARQLRSAASLSQAQLAQAIGVSRCWVADLEHGRLRAVDLRKSALLFAHLDSKLVVNTYPTGEPLRDAGQVRLLERFNARIPPAWRRTFEAVMPIAGDLRARDELLTGPASIGVEAETRPRDLQATERAMDGKLRDSHVDRMILLLGSTNANRALVRSNIATLRQTFPLDTRQTLEALAHGRDPGAHGLVIL